MKHSPRSSSRFSDQVTEKDLKELFEERAAIMEFEGGMTREEAEREARKDLVQQGLIPSSEKADDSD